MALSGRWSGYWEQDDVGRGDMSVTMRLSGGIIEGEGDDCVGPFTFRGTYNSAGVVVMIKEYIGQHCVDYQGTYDGEGTIFGEWSIDGFDSGPFVLRLEGADSVSGEITEIVPAKAEIK